MNIYTIGFTKKDAKNFFEKLRDNEVKKIIDVRLNASSQLAGFAKGKDLQYFLKELLDIQYINDINLAPTKELLVGYRNKEITWDEYKETYIKLLEQRKIREKYADIISNNTCFLCSESESEFCHRKLLTEYLNHNKSFNIIHL